MNFIKAITDYFKSNPLLPFTFRQNMTQQAGREDGVVPVAVLAMGTVDAEGNANTIGFDTRTASYTLTAADAGRLSRMNRATPMNFNVPNNSAAPIPIGFQHIVRQVGAGQVTLVPASGVTIHSAESLVTRTQGSVIALHKVGVNEWDASGDFEAA